MDDIILINFAFAVNASLSVGDVVLFGVPDGTGSIPSSTPFGTVVGVENNRTRIRIRRLDNAPLPPSNAFIFFQKDRAIEASGIIGYEAMVTMTNSSTRKAELFAVSSEVFESSR